MPDTDDVRDVPDERQIAGDGDSEPAAQSGAPPGGADDVSDLDAREAVDAGPIPEDVELAVGAIPSDLFDAREAPHEPVTRTTTSGSTTAGVRRVRNGDLTGALLGSGASAEEAPDALRDTVAAIEELFPGTLVASSPREDSDTDAESDAESETGEAADVTSDHDAQPGEEPRDEDEDDADGRGGAGAAGLFDADDDADAPREDRARAGRRTTPDRSEAS